MVVRSLKLEVQVEQEMDSVQWWPIEFLARIEKDYWLKIGSNIPQSSKLYSAAMIDTHAPLHSVEVHLSWYTACTSLNMVRPLIGKNPLMIQGLTKLIAP